VLFDVLATLAFWGAVLFLAFVAGLCLGLVVMLDFDLDEKD
jgi:hypothetical protein